MPVAYQVAFVFVTAVVGLVTACLLLVAHAGIGLASKPLRLWVAGDLALTVSRVLVLMQPAVFDETFAGLAWLSGARTFVVTTPFIILAISLHVLSVAHLVKRPPSLNATLLLVGGVPLAYAIVCAHVDGIVARTILLLVVAGALALRQGTLLWPSLRRSRGAQVMACVCLLIALTNTGLTLAWTLHPPVLAEPVAGVPAFSPVPALIIDFVASLIMTFAVVLIVQEQLREHIAGLSTHDALTGALNRRGLAPLLAREWERAVRHGRPLSVAMLDLDHFKRINDTHGHAAGDAVLAAFAGQVTRTKRAADLFARWGGEEFLMVMPETSGREAALVVERIRATLAAAPLAERLPTVTVSAGVAALQPDQTGLDVEKLLCAADRRLYVAKTGRNCVVSDDTGNQARTQSTLAPLPVTFAVATTVICRA